MTYTRKYCLNPANFLHSRYSRHIRKHLRQICVFALAMATMSLGACSTAGHIPVEGPVASIEPIDPEETAAYTQFVQCKQDGLALDASARIQQSTAQYVAAAKTLDQCLVDVDAHRSVVPVEERMQIHALTVLDFLKGGEITRARLQLSAFELAYPHRDLYFSDYTSFVDSFRVLLGEATDTAVRADKQGGLNINSALKSDINRHRYWLTH